MYSKVLAGLGIGLLVLASAPLAFADTNVDGNVNTSVQAIHPGFGLGEFIGFHFGKHQSDGDADDATSTATTTPYHPHPHGGPVPYGVDAHVAVGTVTSIDGTSFTLGGRSTTTVTTDGSTVFWGRGGATTSAAVAVGSHVVVLGSTTATSTSSTSFAASIVLVFAKAWGGLRHFFRF